MKRTRLYVGYILGFRWEGIAHWEAINALLSKTLGGCFPSFASGCRKSPEFGAERQNAK